MEKLVCSNCKGALRWNPNDRTFVCQSCGTAFQTDNEFTYRIVDEAAVERARVESEKQRLKHEEKARQSKQLWPSLAAMILLLLLMKFVLFR